MVGPRSRRLPRPPSRRPSARRLGQPGRHLDRAPEGGRLVLGLLELLLRDGAGDDPGAGVDVRLAVLEDRAPDGDRRVEVAVVAEVADGAAVQAAPLPFGRGDELHRPDLGRARQRAGREDRPQRVERVELRPEPRLDVRHEVEDVAVALDLHVLADGDRPGARHAPEVVAPEVDEHHVLGPLLRVALELLGQERVLAGVGATRPGAGDRVGRQAVALDLEEQLGRGADDLEGRRPDEEQVRARVDPAERPVEADPVERDTGRGVGRQLERLAPGEDDLDRLAGRDRVLGDLDRVDVLVAPEARLDRPPEPRRADAPASRRATGPASRSSRRRSGARSARAPRRSPPRRSGSDPRGRAPRCAARRSPTACGSGGRRRGRGRSR